MTGTWELTVRLVPPPADEPAGPVTRVGATSLAMMHLGGLPLEVGHYSADAEALTLRLEVFDPERSGADLRSVAQTAGIALMESAPELGQWDFLVDVRPIPQEPEPEPPPGADYEASIYAAARLLRGLPLAELTSHGRRSQALAGCLIQAADLMIDQLFDDLHVLEAAEDDALDSGEGVTVDVDDLSQLSGLPSRFREHYTADFARSFIVAATDLTSRLTGTWREPACLAQDLAFERLLATAEQIAAVVRLELPPQWREHLRFALIRRDEVDLLMDPEAVLPDELACEAWFRLRNPDQILPPYVVPYPTD
jgi:hypothetical protein